MFRTRNLFISPSSKASRQMFAPLPQPGQTFVYTKAHFCIPRILCLELWTLSSSEWGPLLLPAPPYSRPAHAPCPPIFLHTKSFQNSQLNKAVMSTAVTT